MNIKVEMRPAFEWTCDECGRNNFVSGVVPEMCELERQELINISGGDEGDFIVVPDRVVCPHCGTQFDTMYFGDVVER